MYFFEKHFQIPNVSVKLAITKEEIGFEKAQRFYN